MNDFESRSPHWLGADEPLPLEVLDAIGVADREDGSAEQVARLEARLAPLFQPAHGAESLAPKAAGSASSSLSMLKLAGACVALFGVAALVVWPQREQAAQRSLALSSSEASAHEPTRVVRVESLVTAQRTLEETDATPANAPLETSVVEPSAPAHAERTSSASAHGAAPQNTLALEARLLSRARRALESDADQALKLVERHQLRFPHGVLSEEREAIAIKALRRAGKDALASQRQARFLARYPQSPHAMSLAASTRP